MSSGRNIEAIYGLSPMQEGMLFHTLHAPGAGLYVEQYTARLEGPLDRPRLEKAWAQVVARHAVLRTLFTWERREKPLQIVRERVEATWTWEDWRSLSETEQDANLDTFLEEDRRRGFVLETAPLLRFAVFRVAGDAHRFVWTFHHLLLDGWSMRRVLREAWDRYDALGRGEEPSLPPSLPFREYIGFLQRQDLRGAETHWRARLQGFEAPTPLRVEDRSRRSPWSDRSAEVVLRLPGAATRGLRHVARAHRLTLNTLVRGAWALLLGCYSGEDDVVFGATVSGRPPSLPGAEERVGLFINTLPVRVALPARESVRSWLTELQRRQLEDGEHELAPLADIQRWSEVRREPLFHTVVVFQNVPRNATAAAESELQVSQERYLERSNFPLAVLVFPNDEMEVRFVYDRDRFESATIERLCAHFRIALESVPADPEQPLASISLLAGDERRRLLESWSRSEVPPPEVSTMSAWIEAAARRNPNAVAVEEGEQRCTYGELLERSGRIARRLREDGVGPNVPVAIAIDRRVEMITGIVGILRAGGAYVPLDPEQPRERLRFFLEDTKPPILLTTERFAGALRSLPCRVGTVEEFERNRSGRDAGGLSDAGGADASPPFMEPRTPDPDDLAYVLYTSGSTGAPKGVEVTHRNLVHSTAARGHHYDGPVERFALLSPFVFDSSVAGIFWTLTQGGTLVLPPPRQEQDVVGLAELFDRHRVTHALALPSLHGLLLEHAATEQLRTLRTVVVAGEPCAPAVVQRHFERLPETELHNEYGPTEATVWATVFRVSPDAATRTRVPIGRPIAYTETYVLDRNLSPAPTGVPGELWIGGAGVARGYRNQTERTAERFLVHHLPGVGERRLYRTGDRVRWRPDGNLEFLGRIDDQIKVRGHRIELGEIAAALERHPAVREAAVVLHSAAPDDPAALTAALAALDEDTIRHLLEEIEALDEAAAEAIVARET